MQSKTSILQEQYTESKTSYRSSLWYLIPLAGAVYAILNLLQEQFVQSKTSYRSSIWNLGPRTGVVCAI